MKKKFILIGIFILFLFAIIISNKKEEKTNNGKPTIKIGISLPITGPGAFAGSSAEVAIKMAVDKINKTDTKYEYKIMVEDDKLNSKDIAMIGNKFMNVDHVNAIMSMLGASSKIFTEANNLRDNSIPHFTCSWGTSLSKGDYNFNTIPTAYSYANKLVNKFQKDKVKNIGLIFQTSSSDSEMQKVITQKILYAGINISFNETFNFGEKDYRTFLSKIENKPLDLIYFQLIPTDLQIFCKQLKEMGIKVPLATLDFFNYMEDKTAFENDWFISSNTWNKDFIEEFNRHSKNTSIAACTSNLYDNLNILVNAFENAETSNNKFPTSESVLKYLKSLKTWDGATGKLTIKKSGNIDYEPRLAIIKNGKVELLEE